MNSTRVFRRRQLKSRPQYPNMTAGSRPGRSARADENEPVKSSDQCHSRTTLIPTAMVSTYGSATFLQIMRVPRIVTIAALPAHWICLAVSCEHQTQ